MPSSTVFVTGATGFIAQHICKDLLAKGYTVVGTVRSQAKGDRLKGLLASDNFSYEIVADIVPEGAFDSALENHPEIEYVLHTASPFTFEVTDVEKELLIPAVEGTKNALKAVKAHGKNVKHVVVTSSIAAMVDFTQGKNPDHTTTEEDWCPFTWETSQQNTVTGYIGSKKLAEKAARDFVANEDVNFTLNTVNPVYVFGPQAFDEEVTDKLNTSAEVVNAILSLNSDAEVPATSGFFIDVRDVSKAHIEAFENKAIHDLRLLTSENFFAAQDILDILHKRYPDIQAPIGKPGTGKEARAESFDIDNSKTKELLGFKFINLETCIVDSIDQLRRVRKEKKN